MLELGPHALRVSVHRPYQSVCVVVVVVVAAVVVVVVFWRVFQSLYGLYDNFRTLE